MDRQDDRPEHQTVSGRSGRAPDTAAGYQIQRQGTRRCHYAQDEEVCARVGLGFRVETKANQDATSDRHGFLIRN